MAYAESTLNYLLQKNYSVPIQVSFLVHTDTLISLIEYGVLKIVVVVFFYVHGKHLRSCRDGQLT